MNIFTTSILSSLLIACGEKTDSEPSSEPSNEIVDADADGIAVEDDCNDDDASMPNDDADCDGILTSDDCDDDNPDSTSIIDDADCDGTLTADDCEDNDPESTIVANDADCDGILTADDCDDNNEALGDVAFDADCDGILTDDDCDDNDALSTTIAMDADCDGVLTEEDCDDNDAASTTMATDADCDTILTADDCDDNDNTMPINDVDCDGVATIDDCDDNDAVMPNQDADCDGFLSSEDCDETNSSMPANDVDCDGIPTADDCDDDDPVIIATNTNDADCDGFATIDDCDDTNFAINPNAVDTWYDGIDSNCDGLSDFDQDGDGEDALSHSGNDCDDTNVAINTSAAEIWYDGIDQNCDALSDNDQDQDGFDSDQHGGDDCDDTDAAINPILPEVWYNGIDNDCSGNASDYDQDGDGEDSDLHGGFDCNDSDANTLFNTYYLDNDNDGFGDANAATTPGCSLPTGYADNASDCDDADNAINPSASEVWYNGIDEDCDGGSDYDQDGDGEDSDLHGGFDCDDSDVNINTSATEIWYDTIDQDCDGGSDYDQDGDGEDSDLHGGVDCDDTNASINTIADDGSTVVDGIDDDCDGMIDEDSYLDISLLLPGDLIVTEIMSNPSAVDDADGEWFEIYNDTGLGLNLNGLGFMDDGSNDFVLTGDVYLFANEYLVLGKNGDTATNGGVNLDYVYGSAMSLGNGTDELYIYNSSDFIDIVMWDNGATFPDPSGASISLNPGTNATDNDDGSNWCEATSSYGDGDLGTPGFDNDACSTPTTYAVDVEPLLGSCMGCHGGQFFSSYSTLMGAMSGDFRGNNASANTPLIVAGDAAGSYLYQKMTGTASAGGQMSSSPAQISAVELWINQGAN